MQEIELKILGIDKQDIIKKLENLGATLVYKGLMRVKYFDFADGRIQRADELCRLRDLGDDRVEIVYKANSRIIDGCKVYDEFETYGENFDALSLFLQKLGFKQALYYEKKRWNYFYDRIHFEIDEHPKIPVYVEIEAPSSKEVRRGIQLLGLENYETDNLNTPAFFAKRYPEVELNGLRFEN